MTSSGNPSGPPFPLDKLTRSPWREQALARIGDQRFLLEQWTSQADGPQTISEEIRRTIHDHWAAAEAAAKRHSLRGAAVERVTSHLSAVDADLLRIAPPCYVYGQIPALLEQAKKYLPSKDRRRARLELLATAKQQSNLSDFDRNLIVSALRDAGVEARREVTRLRSFRSVLMSTAAVLTIAVAAVAAFSFAWPENLPMCFSPEGAIVCTTSTTTIPGGSADGGDPGQPSTADPAVIDDAMRKAASGWDVAVVLGVGLLAAAVAAAASLRGIRGTSTPFDLPVALALLKLPTGALTAVLGLFLMRGQFVPGLSALDTSGQIVAWAIILGYSQQLLTHFVDRQAQTVLDDFGRTVADQQESDKARKPAPATGAA